MVHLDARSLNIRLMYAFSSISSYGEQIRRDPAATSRTLRGHVRHVLDPWALGRARKQGQLCLSTQHPTHGKENQSRNSQVAATFSPSSLPLSLLQTNPHAAHKLNSTQLNVIFFSREYASFKLQLPIRARSTRSMPDDRALGTCDSRIRRVGHS